MGFLSILNIQYHHKSNENPLFSINIGKLKLRLRNDLSLSSPTPYITIYIENLHIQLHSLIALKKAKHKKESNQLNKQLSRVSSSLNKIPWWYSLSAFKNIIKLISALPAQLLMAGLANYVDVQVNNFILDIENSSISIEHINFSSILYATISSSTRSSVQYQRHSLKRAQHLFKEKSFEITIRLGPITVGSNHLNDMLVLPSGGHLTVSCHLSAGCVKLKDIDCIVKVDILKSKLRPLLDTIQNMKQGMQTNGNNSSSIVGTKNISEQRSFVVQIFRSMSIIIDTTNLEIDHSNACFSNLKFKQIEIFGTFENQFMLQYSCQLASWVISDRSNSTTVDEIGLLNLPNMKFTMNLSQILPITTDLNPSPINLEGSSVNSLGPSKKHINVLLEVIKPQLCINLSKINILEKLNIYENREQSLQSSQEDKQKQLQTESYNLPQGTLSISIESPSVIFKSEPIGVISWAFINFEMNGKYDAQKSTSSLSKFSDSFVDDSNKFQADSSNPKRPENHSRPSWTNLFRRTWKPKNNYQISHNKLVWNYNVHTKLEVKSTCFDTSNDDNTIYNSKNFVLVEYFGVKIDTCFMGGALKQKNIHYMNADIDIKHPFINLSNQNQLEFWINKVLNQFIRKDKTDSTAKSNDFRYLSNLKMNANMTEFTIVFGGLDRGLKGKRQVPTGYLDNAPEKDIYVNIIVLVQEITLSFIGTYTASSFSSNMSTIKNIQESILANENMSLGDSHLVFKHMIVERVFKSHNQEDQKSILLWVPQIITNAKVILEAEHIILKTSTIFKKIGVEYSIANHYASLVTIVSTLKNMKKIFTKVPTSPIKSSKVKENKVIVHDYQFQIMRFDVHITLSDSTELYSRMDGFKIEWTEQKQIPSMAVQNLTLYGVAPQQTNRWDQLLEMDDVSFCIEKDNNDENTKINQLSMKKLYLRIPYSYELCNIVDSAVTLVKFIKAIHARISKNITFLFYGPQEKKTATLIPNIRLKCGLFTIQFEDDPFEAKLRLIWRTGLIEQANRIAIQDAFELKAHSLMQNSNISPEKGPVTEETDARVNEAWQGLQEHNSKSWRRHIDTAISKEVKFYNQIRSGDYRYNMMADQFDTTFDTTTDKVQSLVEMFSIDIVDLPRYPPLLDITIKHSSIYFSPPTFELDSTRQFMYNVGNGQPIDTPLSTLIPFHLNWKSGETWAQIRDYPIPFILVPATKDNEEPYAWTLSGDYVLGDDMGDQDATRCIHVPIINNYSMDIVRISTPLKFFSVVNIDVHNSALSYICWSVPYQPAIQDITRVLDTFTKPPIDPSQKIGFWDKIRLLIHTQTKISFIGGGDLAVVMKGTRDPYDMSQKGFGLAKVWRNNVVWLIGHKNPEGEFMQIISQDYAFGVPDLLRGGYISPYIMTVNQIGKQEMRSVHHSVSSSTLNSSSNKSRFVKMALKLSGGIRMGLGCHLERMCDCEICDENNDVMPEAREVHKERLLHFLPHYKVKYKTPQNVHQKDYDAYKGFRSDFIHFSLSIIKLSSYDADQGPVTGNSMHLSPGFIDHFVNWFRLFGGAMSYPLRDGSLFPKTDTRPTQKFGRHMSTMKYKVVVSPLIVGYFIKDENVVSEETIAEELGDSVGLKGFVKNFSMDIHQRRVIVNVSDYKLDQKRLKANWPFTEAEVQLKSVDLRAVKASYTGNVEIENVNNPTPMEDDYLLHENSGLKMMEGLNCQLKNDLDSADWIDLDDFVEIGVTTPDILPTIQILPFAFVPCIYYLRQINRDDLYRNRYLDKTHNCILGTAIGTREMQMSLLQDRCNSIDIQIRKHQTRLHNIETKQLQASEEKEKLHLKEMSDTTVEKTRILYEKRHMIQEYLKELTVQNKTFVKKTDMYSTSTIFGKDSLTEWEELMGHFKVRYIAHNPQILWNNSIRNIVYHGLDLRDHRRALAYYMTSRTAKFLRDLIDTIDFQYKQFVLDDNEGDMNASIVEELINKLLAEQSSTFYVSNETEQQQSTTQKDEVDISLSENVNNPLMQLKTIPNDYVMKSSYLIDLLNPQISLQSDCDVNNIVLVANERTQVKGFNIIDESDPDVEMEIVKHRTIVSLDNLQFFVAKKEQFDSVDLLLDNHYGAKESDNWLAWIPPEMLINYVKSSDKFQRIGDQIAATLQYDKYNPLRIKANSNVCSQAHPFEDRCDSVQLNFPKLKLIADSAQYNAIYQVATDLLLYKEPAKKERLARLREIMMAADRSSMFEATEKIIGLQQKARHLIYARDQYCQNRSLLDSQQLEEFKTIRLELYDTLEELYLGMEAIKLMQSNQKKDYHEPKTNLKFVFCARQIEWEMLTNNERPLCECMLNNFTYDFVSKEDHSSINTLEVDIIQVKNLSRSPVFVDVLGPYVDSHKPYDFSRHKMLRCYFVSLAPVGGIPVTQHLEINLHPLRLQMTYSFGKELAYYLFPPEKTQKQHEVTASTVLEFDLAIDQPSSLVSLQSGYGEKLDNNAVKSMAEAQNSSTSLSIQSSNNLSNDLQQLNNTTSCSTVNNSFKREETSDEVTSNSRGLKKNKKQTTAYKIVAKNRIIDDLSVMKKRASSNRTFILVKIPGARHCLSYQGPKEKNLEDLRDFAFEQPTLEFRNETWSWFELVSNIKRDFMRAALLHNSPALLKEKLLRRHPRENTKPIESSISIYSTPTYVTDVRHQPISYDTNSESSRNDELEDILDTVSLYSARSEDVSSESGSKKSSHLWSKLRKTKKINQNNDESPTTEDNSLPYINSHALSRATQHLHDEAQLTIKGKYLLGKYYNGPTQWLHKSTNFKTRQQATKKNLNVGKI
ncbi:golgi-body localization protein domain-containing protein [Cokeromyces recurvatus]|uniref:golgi-body localization protein domain-containing protein n=1 Tax=Cokeromyces recurvatus TaxID=90255 RepID=UPI00221F6109|nr:golgi-body localization protein domain-containing protein [Cokeromyces recurvatus]KAI7900356.1 golgi-body localization protein domain-containing protein [Cokeromyces recurvatus]